MATELFQYQAKNTQVATKTRTQPNMAACNARCLYKNGNVYISDSKILTFVCLHKEAKRQSKIDYGVIRSESTPLRRLSTLLLSRRRAHAKMDKRWR
jgi:hypothetical protein